MSCPNCGSLEIDCWATGLCSCRVCGEVWDKNEEKKRQKKNV
jgi:uncharacterized Zn finger protein (UPF0148 family)